MRTSLDLTNGLLTLSVPSFSPGFRGLLGGKAIYHLWAGTIRIDLEVLGCFAAELLLYVLSVPRWFPDDCESCLWLKLLSSLLSSQTY